MALNRDVYAAFAFLVFSLAYGWQAFHIDMFPGQEFEPFTPRTWPFSLAVIGIALSVAQLVKSLRESPEGAISWGGFDWVRVGLLTVAMVVYAALFTWLGFLVSTTLFLVTGYAILGERRPLVLFAASVLVVVGFWAIMTQLLGLYLAPGEAFRGWIW